MLATLSALFLLPGMIYSCGPSLNLLEYCARAFEPMISLAVLSMQPWICPGWYLCTNLRSEI
jgi:hypothetical protein